MKDQAKLVEGLNEAFGKDSLYLSRDFSLDQLANKLDIEYSKAEELIRQLYGHSFGELLDMYRVDFAKKQIEQGVLENVSLGKLASKSGFDSQPTFASVFQKETGVLPTEYRNTKLREE
ncbi:helix-turn-helix transcriptional regulator [Algoriphagus sp. H41]|uniref:Helix-turn-helix transcriptional regulator n=1 Tax=Algoriphagus oliviformis TaxID=2811231 RepID=A0ABS3C1T2_9BACT|nr:helix-turn-helix transcriptional regulator [Algoriphagus oliviformis]MBN7810551.1 helix-turn-helix transcriptional regulator [Algoriphagus oliviformis]